MPKINILIAFDKRYSSISGVMLTSLLRSNRDCVFDVYAMVDDSWNGKQKHKFEKLLKKHKSRLVVYDMSAYDFLKKYPLNPSSHITLPTYYRLIASEILPQSVSKILYLDGDIIINGDIKPLWNIDLTGYAFAGANDCSFNLTDNYLRLHYDSKYGYYNAGVTLYNVEFWRANNLSQRIIEYIEINQDKLLWLDQDAVNGMLHEFRKQISIKYNFQVVFFGREFWKNYSDKFQQEIIEASKNPVIIHYVGNPKPWHYWCYRYPFFEKWKKTAYTSLWTSYFIPPMNMAYFRFLMKKIFKKEKVLALRNGDMEEISYGL